MPRVIPWIASTGNSQGWHVIGEDPEVTQYNIKWAGYATHIHVVRMTKYGNGGVNSGTGEAWGEQAEWALHGTFGTPKRPEGCTDREYHALVEERVKEYIAVTLNLTVDWSEWSKKRSNRKGPRGGE